MKINYQKSELYGVGLEEGEMQEFANCERGEMRLPASTYKIGKRELFYVAQKMEKRLDTWMGGMCHMEGGRLLNSCLSIIPIYAMGFYKLLEGIHKKMDSVRGRFYWQVVRKKKIPHDELGALSRPKDYGGLWSSKQNNT